MFEEWFRQLVSGRRRGFAAFFFRALLFCFSVVYGFVISARSFLYKVGFFRVYCFDVPVISVGNITLGGTGKTPFVAWLCEYFISCGFRPAIVSRGYGSGKSSHNINDDANDGSGGKFSVNDEYLELAARLPGVYHFQGIDRVAAVSDLLKFAQSSGEKIDVVILDDGMQHLRLGRDFEIVLLDAVCPFGYGYIFPRGLLREFIGGLRRADAVLISRANLITQNERDAINKVAKKIAPNAIYSEIIFVPERVIYYGEVFGKSDTENGTEVENIASGNIELGLDSIKGKNILAFCGIGNPDAFNSMLLNCDLGGQIYFERYPDHYEYTERDVLEIISRAKKLDVDIAICTMKDFVKVSKIIASINRNKLIDKIGVNIPIAAIKINVEFLNKESQNKLQEKINISNRSRKFKRQILGDKV
ncbi:MAG: tetraacyldisaccharide 4'-kinase [Planctomycetaceae bacterium]|jgi:tetraacyldisaccharide 4'-kinase|nr:tetraacyldisaccharide 4'-kinase [Planctomycetaceae bacterium]